MKETAAVYSILALLAMTVFVLPAGAPPLVSPQTIESLGFTYSQRAFFVNASLPWIDVAGLREEFFYQLEDHTDDEIRELVKDQFPVTSQRHLRYRDFLVTPFEVLDRTPVLLHHPDSYIRSGTIVFRDKHGRQIGIMNLKPSGNSPEREEEELLLLGIWEHLNGKRKLSAYEFRLIRKKNHFYARVVANAVKDSETSDSSPLAIRGFTHSRTQNTFKLRMFEIGESLASGMSDSTVRERFIKLAREADYTNATASLANSIVEIIIQRVCRRKFQAYYDAEHFYISTIPNFFLLAPEIGILKLGSTPPVPVGIVGRRASWRFGIGRKFKLPAFFNIGTILPNGLQFTARREMLDFELPDHKDIPDLAWSQTLGRNVDRLAQTAVTQYFAGNVTAISELIGRFDTMPLPQMEFPSQFPPELAIMAREREATSLINLNLNRDQPVTFLREDLESLFFDDETASATGAILLNRAEKYPTKIVDFFETIGRYREHSFSLKQRLILKSLIFTLYRIDPSLGLRAARELREFDPEGVFPIFHALVYEAITADARILNVDYPEFTAVSRLADQTENYLARAMVNFLFRQKILKSEVRRKRMLDKSDPKGWLLRERVLRRWQAQITDSAYPCPTQLKLAGDGKPNPQ